MKNLKKPDDLQKNALKAYDNIVSSVKNKIFDLISSAALLKKSVAEIENKLETPDCKKNILLVTHQILQSNVYARKMLKLASDNLNRAVDEIHNKLFVQTSAEKNIFRSREVFEILCRHHSDLKKEYDKILDQKFFLQREIISSQRATEMAKNIFVHGDFKKLRSDLHRLKKEEEKFSKNLHLARKIFPYQAENFARPRTPKNRQFKNFSSKSPN